MGFGSIDFLCHLKVLSAVLSAAGVSGAEV
jgi:hypothetical protein